MIMLDPDTVALPKGALLARPYVMVALCANMSCSGTLMLLYATPVTFLLLIPCNNTTGGGGTAYHIGPRERVLCNKV
jgi:hypothetical protein